MARVYATSGEYETYTGATAPASIGQLLADASRMLEARVFRLCWYEADETTGMPTNAFVLAAFSDATCAQAQWFDEVGDSTGAAGAGWTSLSLGSASMSRSGPVSGDASPAREIAPKAWDALTGMDLTPDIFRLGEVGTW